MIPQHQTQAPALPPVGVRPEARPLGEILIEMRALAAEQLAEGLAAQHLEGERIGESLVRLKHCSEWDVCRALAQQFGLPARESVDILEIEDELVERLPIQFARINSVLPWKLDRQLGVLKVLSADPLRILDLDDLCQVYGADLEITLLPKSFVLDLINRVYARRTKDVDLEKKDEEYAEEDEDILHASAEDAPIIRFVNSLIFNASKEKASDIHIEPGDKEIIVRNRVDGVLHEVKRAPKGHLPSIIARVKIMAGLNIAEKRLPQDGRIRRKIAGKEVDMRVATVPTAHGERVTIRLLDKSAVMLNLDSIGIAADHLRMIRERHQPPARHLPGHRPDRLRQDHHAVLGLSEINKPDLNILTVEDPVEYQLAGISQVQVQSKINLTFAAGLRSFLRHDPDVIMVGEIRDVETAEIAIQASLTGHLVLSTIHTNDAATGITRLVDMGVQPFLVASSLVALQAQRLVRRVCPHCCEPYRPPPTRSRTSASTPTFFTGEPAAQVPMRDERRHGHPARRAGRAQAAAARSPLPRRRLREVPRQRLLRPNRPLRGPDDHRGDPPPGHPQRRLRADQGRRARAGHAHAARRRRAQGRAGITTLDEVARVTAEEA
jgi:general secretion pathway protein E